MAENLDVLNAAVSLLIRAALLAARFSGRVRQRCLKRLSRVLLTRLMTGFSLKSVFRFAFSAVTSTPSSGRPPAGSSPSPRARACGCARDGDAPLTVHFSAEATDPDGTAIEYVWTFGDGTFSYNPDGGPDKAPYYLNPNPVKTFCNPGLYTAYLTVTDNDGNAVTREIHIQVTGTAPASVTIGPSRQRARGSLLRRRSKTSLGERE